MLLHQLPIDGTLLRRLHAFHPDGSQACKIANDGRRRITPNNIRLPGSDSPTRSIWQNNFATPMQFCQRFTGPTEFWTTHTSI